MQLEDATVLVVDDEPRLCEILREWLEREGSSVLVAENGKQALEILQQGEVSAIVTDIRMPVMDGAELVKLAKAMGKYTPAAVAISGFSDLTPREAYDLGVEAQLSKPVERKVLIAALRRTLMPREELWAEPFGPTSLPDVMIELGSLSTALQQKLIAFGRGGFCFSSGVRFQEEASIGFELNFVGDRQVVSGQGIVRWSVAKERLTGIEITGVTAAARDWVAAIARSNQTVSFIPRST
jgi:CheY-like chemotaxis protein